MDDTRYVLKEVSENNVTLNDWLQQLKRHAKAISIWVGLVAIITGALVFNQSNYYKAQAVLTSSLFNKNELKPVLEMASNGVGQLSTASLARIMNIDESTVAHIKEISISDIQAIEGKQYIFMIEITATDSSVIPEVFEGVNHLTNNNDYLEREFKNRGSELDSMITKISQQVADLQQMKLRSENSFNSSQGVFVYTSNIHSEIIAMEERLLKLKQEADELHIVEYMQRPLYPERPEGPNRLVIILASIFIALGVGVTISTATVLF